MQKRLLILILICCCGCAGYGTRVIKARQAVALGDYETALAQFPANGRDKLLYALERGLIQQKMGSYQASRTDLQLADDLIRKIEERAVISGREVTAQAGALLVNENVTEYQGEDFEKILLHTHAALNYLMLGDTEGARVEIRRSYTRQQQLLKKHEKEIQQSDANPLADPAYDAVKKIAAASAYQSAFGYYVSAYVYELNREPDAAYIDLKQAIKAAPDCKPIQHDLLRLSRELGFDHELWTEKFGPYQEQGGREVMLVMCSGQAPLKEEFSFAWPVAGSIVFISLPVYNRFEPPARPLTVRAGDKTYQTAPLSNIQAMAARNLLDQMPILITKQLARAYAKSTITRQLGESYGISGDIFSFIATAVSERADLRSWSSLPAEVQVARIWVPAATDQIYLKYAAREYPVSINGRSTLIFCHASQSGLAINKKEF